MEYKIPSPFVRSLCMSQWCIHQTIHNKTIYHQLKNTITHFFGIFNSVVHILLHRNHHYTWTLWAVWSIQVFLLHYFRRFWKKSFFKIIVKKHDMTITLSISIIHAYSTHHCQDYLIFDTAIVIRYVLLTKGDLKLVMIQWNIINYC